MGRIPCLPGSLIRRNEATEAVDWLVGNNDVFPGLREPGPPETCYVT